MEKLGIRISYNIKKIMKEKNINQNQLSELLGKTPQNMSVFFKSLEKNSCSNVKTLQKIAKVLNVDISFFFA